jgi:FixJ family two-component response regulator
MPAMTGLQLAACIQDRFPGLPIILATGYAELPVDPAKMGVLKLAKPCSQHDIATAIHMAMRSRDEVKFAQPMAARI